MARDFEQASSEGITLSIGSLGWNGSTGLTYAFLTTRESTGTNRTIIALGSGGTARSTFSYQSSGNTLQLAHGSTGAATVGTLSNNAWNIIAVTKTGGTSLARFHSCDMVTGVWTHASTGSGIADMAATPNTVYLGRTAANTNHHDGCMALGAVWKRSLSDAEIELLYGGLRAWQSLKPDALWPLNQNDVAQPLVDWTGGGANQTAISGTSVATNHPYGWRWGGSVRRVARGGASGGPVLGAAALTADGLLSSLGSLSLVSSAALTASGILSAVPSFNVYGQSALTATAILSALGIRGALGSSALTASATLASVGKLRLGGSTAITGTATLSAAAVRIFLAAAVLSSTATVSMAGTVTPPVLGEAVLSATAFLQSGSDLYKLGRARLYAEAFVEAAPNLQLTGTAAFQAAAILAATPSSFLAPASAAMSASALLEVNAILGGFERLGQLDLQAVGVALATARVLMGARIDLSAVALLDVAGRTILRGVIPLTASATLVSSGLVLPAGGPYGPFGNQKLVGHRRFDRYTGRRNAR